MKKKIIFVTQALWIGGIETSLINLLSKFNYEKYDVTLLVLHAVLDMLEQVPPQCRVIIADRKNSITFNRKYRYAKLYHLTEKGDNPSKLHQTFEWTVPIIKWVENRLYIRYIYRLMRQEFFDTCVIYSDVAAETAVRAIRAKKYLMYYHHGAMRHVYHDNIAYRKCERIIAVSQNQAIELRKFVPKAAGKIITIHNLTDVAKIREKGACKTEEAFDHDKFNIVTVGRVSHEKGMDIAVQACAKIVEDGLDKICWWIVGGGPAMDEIRSAVSEKHLESFVKTVGMKNNPYPYIRQADLYVQPSRFEGYPMTVLEALILGQPVLSTDNNGAREILGDKNIGLLCEVNVDIISRQIEEVISDPAILSSLRENVKKMDFDRYNQDYMLQLENCL